MKALFSSEKKIKEKEREIFWILIIIIINPLTLANTATNTCRLYFGPGRSQLGKQKCFASKSPKGYLTHRQQNNSQVAKTSPLFKKLQQ